MRVLSTRRTPDAGGQAEEAPAVVLAGRLDGRCTAMVREALLDHLAEYPGADLVVDLTEVESIDLTALRLLAATALRVDRAGHRVVLRGCSPSLRRVVASCPYGHFFRIERQPPA